MKVIVIEGQPYYLQPVAQIAQEDCIRMIKEKQLEIYVEKCSEPSSEIVEGRVYEI